MNKDVEIAKLDTQLKELLLKVRCISIYCDRDDVFSIIIDDLCSDIDVIVNKIDNTTKMLKNKMD